MSFRVTRLTVIKATCRPNLRPRVRYFTSSRPCADRAVVYSENGDPSKVLSVLTFPNLPPPGPDSVNIKFLLSPINPADINVIEGVYPSKPIKTRALAPSGKGSEEEPVFIGGNEGLAKVTAVGSRVSSLKINDWVVVTKQQHGTWSTRKNVAETDVALVPDAHKLDEAQAATITVNPPTAYTMLTEFVHLEKGDWVVQNGANSAVGQAVIQIAAAQGLKTINFVRNRENIEQLKYQLQQLGATHVLTYDDLSDKPFRDKIKAWTGGKDIKLGLNCVGGKETTLMSRLLGQDAHLVSYGAMSKQPLSLPTSLFIFKNLTCHGFWMSRWYAQKTPQERGRLMRTLVNMMADGQLKSPEHEIITIKAEESDSEASQKVHSIMSRIAEGRYGKKAMLKLESA